MPRLFFLLSLLAVISSCSHKSSPAQSSVSTPEENFEILWKTFNENYAFFELHAVNWQQQHDVYRSKVKASTTRDELGAIFADMLAPLHDGHITVSYNEVFYFRGQSERTTFKTAFKGLKSEFTQITDQILRDNGFDAVKLAGAKVKDEPWLRYSQNKEGIGYLAISRFFNDVKGVTGSDEDQLRDQQEMLRLLEQVMNELSGCKKLIIDLRTNGGGHSGRECAAMFISDSVLTHQVSVMKAGIGSALQPQYLIPSRKEPYSQELVLLVSDRSASSAEDFVLSLYRRKDVTLVGTATAGMLSDMYNFSLPNGMEVTLSNQRYFDHTGTVLLEGRGILPDIEVPYSASSITEKKDPQLSRALDYLKNGK